MTVDDPDAVFDRAIAAGSTVVWPVKEEYGWRLGRLVESVAIGFGATATRWSKIDAVSGCAGTDVQVALMAATPRTATSGCSCSTGGSPSSFSLWGSVLLLATLVGGRRRRR